MKALLKIFAAIWVVLTVVTVSSCACGGTRDALRIHIMDGNAYTLSVWMWVKDRYFTPYHSSFSIKQDIDKLAATLASKKDQHKNPLKTEVFKDAYILITQEATDGQFNYYLLSYSAGSGTAPRPEYYRYEFYLPKATFTVQGSYYMIAMPYHLLSGVQIQRYPYENAYGSRMTCQLAATPDDIYNFYDSISTCTIEKHQDGAFIVEDKTSGNRLKITINESGGTPNITFEALS